MKDSDNLHLKVQALCDCYSTTDPLKEMSDINDNDSPLDSALKWLALAVLHGVNSNADKISIKQSKDGAVKVMAEYRDTELPSPGPEVGSKVFEAIREITHLEGSKGKTGLAMGLKDSSLDLKLKVKDKGDQKKVSITFP